MKYSNKKKKIVKHMIKLKPETVERIVSEPGPMSGRRSKLKQTVKMRDGKAL